MKRGICFLILVVLSSCGGGNSDVANDDWYSGGTLHKSDIATWKTASDKNKLATCADYIANIKEYEDMALMKEDAMEFLICIDEATSGSELSTSQPTNEIAASCILLMGIAD